MICVVPSVEPLSTITSSFSTPGMENASTSSSSCAAVARSLKTGMISDSFIAAGPASGSLALLEPERRHVADGHVEVLDDAVLVGGDEHADVGLRLELAAVKAQHGRHHGALFLG